MGFQCSFDSLLVFLITLQIEKKVSRQCSLLKICLVSDRKNVVLIYGFYEPILIGKIVPNLITYNHTMLQVINTIQNIYLYVLTHKLATTIAKTDLTVIRTRDLRLLSPLNIPLHHL